MAGLGPARRRALPRSAWLEAHGYFSLNMVSTRGCPFHCNWCAKPIWGQRYAMRSPANVAEEMATWSSASCGPTTSGSPTTSSACSPNWVAEFAQRGRGARRRHPVHDPVARRPDDRAGGGRRSPAPAASRLAGRRERQPEDPRRHGKGHHASRTIPGVRATAQGTPASGPASSSSSAIRARPSRTSWPPSGWCARRCRTTSASASAIRCRARGSTSMVRAQLGEKDHWDDSNDLAMMFQGTYQTPLLPQAPQAAAPRPGDPAAARTAGQPLEPRVVDELEPVEAALARAAADRSASTAAPHPTQLSMRTVPERPT